MDWQEVVEHPGLQDLPFRIETDENGRIIMSAVRVLHSLFQGKIVALLQAQRPNGFTMVECAVLTRKGTKVADAAWASIDRVLQIRDAVQAVVAPEVCVEVLSSSNTPEEMNEKRELYFERGALEFWICDEAGAMRFFNRQGEIEESVLFPDFPIRVEI